MHENSPKEPMVFISHAGEDTGFAKWIAKNLRKAGIKARLDQLELESGDNIIAWMNKAISESDYLLVLLSSSSVQKYWVNREVESGIMKETDPKPMIVIPAVLSGLSDIEIPALLRPIKYIDFRKEKKDALSELISRLKKDLSDKPSVVAEETAEGDMIEVIIHSNQLAIHTRLKVPTKAISSYLLRMLNDKVGLRFSTVDDDSGIEMLYTYSFNYDGEQIEPYDTLEKVGVKNGDSLKLIVHPALRNVFGNGKPEITIGGCCDAYF